MKIPILSRSKPVAPEPAAPPMTLTEADLRALASVLLEAETDTLDEPGWLRLGSGSIQYELDEAARQDAVAASYYYWMRDPYAARGVQLYKDYIFGRGLSFKAADDRVQVVLERFWKDARNRQSLSSASAQWALQERIMLAGELFLAFFVNRADGGVVMRLIEPGEIKAIITHEEDRLWPLYYQRMWMPTPWDWSTQMSGYGQARVDYIPDWLNLKYDSARRPFPPDKATVGDRRHLVVCHHVKVNTHGQRGVPVLLRALPWIRANKGFMEDRATLTLALATFAWRAKIKGSKASIQRMADLWGQFDVVRRYGAGGKERREGAQTLIENEGISTEQVSVDTGASNAYLDHRMFRQQVAAGFGVTEPNLTGDPSVSNLASIREMTGPEFRLYESWQQMWKDEMLDIFAFVIRMAQAHGELPQVGLDTGVECDFPSLIMRDLPEIVGAASQLIQAESVASTRFIADKRLARYILNAFGEEDVEAALEELDELAGQLAAKGVTTAAIQAATVDDILGMVHEVTREYAH